VVLRCGEVLQQPAERQRRGADTGAQPHRIEIVRLPAERRAQPLERTEQVLDLAARERRLPRLIAGAHRLHESRVSVATIRSGP